MDELVAELAAGWPGPAQLAHVFVRLVVAGLLGGVIGLQRERAGKSAGLRTHTLVALGSALFMVAPIEYGMDHESMSRVIQGLIAGIGFLCAGAILKLDEEHRVKGLTSAAGLWLTAAVGVAAGLGLWGAAVIGVALVLFTLESVVRVEKRIGRGKRDSDPGDTGP